MESNNHKSLEKAKAFFYSWRMLEAYNIFRRYFDRLPFQPEKEHAEYIGTFVRVLFELGKEFELKFYLTELERHYEKSKAPYIAYALGVVYSYSGQPKMEAAKTIFEEIVKDPEAKSFHPKAKMMLADYYSRKNDMLACRMLIDSIEVPAEDKTLGVLVEIWRAVIARREKKLSEAKATLETLLAGLTPDVDWYSFFSAKVILAMTYIDEGDIKKAKAIVAEVKAMFEGRHFKSVQVQLDSLDALLKEKTGLGTLKFEQVDDECTFTYANKTLQLKNNSPAERLLLLLVKKKFLDKAIIVKNLYDRQYNAELDDKLIYYHIHTLRKRLKDIGLPAEAIANEGNGYRLVPEVETVGGDL
jgi:tetratricopeptide (TPR) repeat protein